MKKLSLSLVSLIINYDFKKNIRKVYLAELGVKKEKKHEM